jgi:hypothetical protein
MKGAILCMMLAVACLVTGCVSSRPIDVELAEQNQENIDSTNVGTAELVDLLDEAKAETPDAAWTVKWDEGAKTSHALQAAANVKVAAKVLERAKKNNPEK